ncbi:MAG: succinate dehydrogenase, hydrophobic membrane anchor protein [Pseudomonadota bacterium]
MSKRRPVELDGTGHRGQRTALKTIRGLGTANAGTEHFIKQRVTAVANAVLALVLTVVAIALSGKTYDEAVALIGSPFVAVPLGLAFISSAIHLRLGIQVVVEDYIHAEGTKVALLLANTFFAILIAGAGLYAIATVMFRSVVSGMGAG